MFCYAFNSVTRKNYLQIKQWTHFCAAMLQGHCVLTILHRTPWRLYQMASSSHLWHHANHLSGSCRGETWWCCLNFASAPDTEQHKNRCIKTYDSKIQQKKLWLSFAYTTSCTFIIILLGVSTRFMTSYHHHHYSACTISVRSSACYQ